MIVSGTFSGTGSSTAITGAEVYIDMTFAGTATVNVQWQVDGVNWRTVQTFTGSDQIVVDAGGIPVRLNCSAHTDNVTYALRSE
jgi:hypothetical protein